MAEQRTQGWSSKLAMSAVAWIAPLFVFGMSEQAFAQRYHPEHPVVKGMVDRAVAFLSSANIKGDVTSPPNGAEILTAYTIYKVTYDANHPVVASGVETAKNYIETITRPGMRYENKAMYVLAMSCMLLASVDSDAYGGQLIKARDFYLSVQQPLGGYGYIDGSHSNMSGDLSQTQYVMLAFWTMSQLGIQIPEEKVYNTIKFLFESQNNDTVSGKAGAWPYQYDPSHGHGSDEITHSRAACGLSAILIAADILGIYRNRMAEADEDEDLIPTAFRRVLSEAQKKKKGFEVDRFKLDTSIERGVNYFRRTQYQRSSWHYYYLYSKERFESFLEISTMGKSQSKNSPDWYVNEVEVLLKSQSSNGAFGQGEDQDVTLGPVTSTCFATLFLIRSTQKAIGTLKDATVVGGTELPKDLASVTRAGTKLLSATENTSIDDALAMLENDKKMGAVESLVAKDIVLSPKGSEKRKDELNRFARLLRSKDYKARQIAAKVLGRSDDLDVVPDLIYALTDPNKIAALNAENSLRLISRQLDKYVLPRSGTISDKDRLEAVREWKRWYLDIKPDYIFVD